MRRYTFVVQVYADGITTLENLATHQQMEISDLHVVGREIGRWVDSLAAAPSASQAPPLSDLKEDGA
jgi:hypothetical protein